VSLMETGGGEGTEAGVSRSAAAAEALPSPSPPSKRTRMAAPAALQAQAQGQEQASADRALVTTTTTTTTTTGMRGRSRAAVVSSRELMERVLAFTAGESREAREDVGRAAAVCRVWRDAAYGEEVWGRMASELMPVVGAGGLGLGGGGRRYVAEVGRCLAEQRVRREDEWWEGLRLHVEVWDGRDGLRMLSVEGRLDLETVDVYEQNPVIRLGSDRHEVVGPAFSAASRDPEHHRLDAINDYFRRLHEEGMPTMLCTRVVVRDVRSGRRALLWETGRDSSWDAGQVDPRDPSRRFLPPDSLMVGTMLQKDRAVIHPPCRGGGAAATGGYAEEGGAFLFYLRPEAGQEGVPARDKLWRVAGANAEHYGEQDSFLLTRLPVGDRNALGRFVWSLLSCGGCGARSVPVGSRDISSGFAS
jgi:hypothetical protein